MPCNGLNISKEKLYQTNIGTTFNVILPFEEYKWEITPETKIINGYKCYKATTHKEEFNYILNVNRTFDPIVWFAPEIPAPYGPKGLDGLPGLVLEGTINGKMYFYATKIEFDIKKEIRIEKPTKGKYITEKEFAKVLEESVKDQK